VDTSFLPPKPKYEETEPEIYTPGELKTILEAADDYMGIVIRMALMLGLREQEIMYAEWTDIDWHYATFRVQGKPNLGFAVKDSAQRQIPIPDALLQMLTEWQKLRPETTLIVGNDKGQPEGHLLRKLKHLAHRAGLNCGVCAGCLKNSECEQWFLHKFRATFCTLMLREADPATVMELAGHSNIETTMRYLAPASGEEMQAHANAIQWTE
jgi:integrase